MAVRQKFRNVHMCRLAVPRSAPGLLAVCSFTRRWALGTLRRSFSPRSDEQATREPPSEAHQDDNCFADPRAFETLRRGRTGPE